MNSRKSRRLGSSKHLDRRVGKLEAENVRLRGMAREFFETSPEARRLGDHGQRHVRRGRMASAAIFVLGLLRHRWHTEQLVRRSSSIP